MPLTTESLEESPVLAGRYVLTERLGEGGMGEVWRAHDEVIDRDVALKVVPQGADARQLQQEARALGKLHHPNVATVFDQHDAQQGEPGFIVMEIVEGVSLAKQLREGRMSPAQVAALGTQLTAGLQAAHERGVVHRDVKPANVIVTPSGVAKLVDFGIARDSSESPLADLGPRLGTLAYAAPERLEGRTATPASDVFSLGTVLFEALNGRQAYPVAGPRQPLSWRTGVGTPPLNNLVDRMMRDEPDARPGLPEVGRRLAQIDDDATIALGTHVLPDTSAPERTRKPWLFPAIAGVLLALALALILGAVALSPADPVRRGAATPSADGRETTPATTARVPDVSGMSVAEAASRLDERGFRTGRVQGEGDMVVSTKPTAGLLANDGIRVDLETIDVAPPAEVVPQEPQAEPDEGGPPPWAKDDKKDKKPSGQKKD